jgi:hypothetical protein
MATVTANTAQPVSGGNLDYEKELRKAYNHTGTGSSGFESGYRKSENNSVQNQGQHTLEAPGNVQGVVNTGNVNAYLNQMYDASLESQKQQLQSNYETNVSNLEAEKEKAAREHDEDLNRTYVESYKKAKHFNEVQNAYGLTTGAMGQAALAQGNQLQADLTSLRANQQQIDAEIERQRSILSKEYTAAIAKAQADNDFERAQALYEQAKIEEERMLQKQKEAAELMAQYGDYSLLKEYYGLGSGYGGYGMGGGSSGSGNWTTAAGNPKYNTNPTTDVPYKSGDSNYDAKQENLSDKNYYR